MFKNWHCVYILKYKAYFCKVRESFLDMLKLISQSLQVHLSLIFPDSNRCDVHVQKMYK